MYVYIIINIIIIIYLFILDRKQLNQIRFLLKCLVIKVVMRGGREMVKEVGKELKVLSVIILRRYGVHCTFS